eukprot:8173731-Ditylum_brightwellii.AAC.1
MKLIAQDWKAFYPDANEDIPLDMPEACGNSVQINAVVDADQHQHLDHNLLHGESIDSALSPRSS